MENINLIVGNSNAIVSTLQTCKKVAPSHGSIFITGECGSGKEIIARYIHSESCREGPFVAINCSAIPENLLESEMFGHARGAFTGAVDKKAGLFEEAENGTLFLDEIGDLTIDLQVKLLRVLQDKKIKRIGENEFRPVNARIISATHKNLIKEVEANKFREDLFFRLNVIPIHVPSLRERVDDILPLAEYFLLKYIKLNNFSSKQFSNEAKNYLLENPWQGNVRELENSVERAVVLCKTETIEPGDFFISETSELEASDKFELLGESIGSVALVENTTEDGAEIFKVPIYNSLLPLQHVVQKYIEFAVNRNGGAKDRTAKEIGIDRKTLYRKMKSFEHYAQ